MKRLPKYTPAEVRNDPYGLLTKKCRKLLARMKQKPYMKNYISNYHAKKSINVGKNICKSSDTEKYVYELKDNKYIETVFIKRRDGGTVCVSTQVGCPVGCIFVSPGERLCS